MSWSTSEREKQRARTTIPKLDNLNGHHRQVHQVREKTVESNHNRLACYNTLDVPTNTSFLANVSHSVVLTRQMPSRLISIPRFGRLLVGKLLSIATDQTTKDTRAAGLRLDTRGGGDGGSWRIRSVSFQSDVDSQRSACGGFSHPIPMRSCRRRIQNCELTPSQQKQTTSKQWVSSWSGVVGTLGVCFAKATVIVPRIRPQVSGSCRNEIDCFVLRESKGSQGLIVYAARGKTRGTDSSM